MDITPDNDTQCGITANFGGKPLPLFCANSNMLIQGSGALDTKSDPDSYAKTTDIMRVLKSVNCSLNLIHADCDRRKSKFGVLVISLAGVYSTQIHERGCFIPNMIPKRLP